MLELRPVCENCNKALPPHAEEAMICSFECTFCKSCVDDVLQNVCPNCGGGFCRRPIRPVKNHRGEACLLNNPAGTQPKHRPVDPAKQADLIARLKNIPPTKR